MFIFRQKDFLGKKLLLLGDYKYLGIW